MIDIRPVSDLRNKFPELEKVVKSGKTVFLTKNGYGSMVVMSLEKYASITENLELQLDAADEDAIKNPVRYTTEEVYSNLDKLVAEH